MEPIAQPLESSSELRDAARDGRLETVRALLLLLLGAGTDHVNDKDEHGVTAIWLASQEGHADVVRLLLGAGADPDETAFDGRPALWHPAARGHVDVLKLLLGAGADPDVADASTRSTPLMIATIRNHLEAVRALLEAGADVDGPGPGSPLHAAMVQEKRDMALLLLNHGAGFPDMANFPDTIRLVGWLAAAGKEREALHAAEVDQLRLEVRSLEDGIPHLLQAAVGRSRR